MTPHSQGKQRAHGWLAGWIQAWLAEIHAFPIRSYRKPFRCTGSISSRCQKNLLDGPKAKVFNIHAKFQVKHIWNGL